MNKKNPFIDCNSQQNTFNFGDSYREVFYALPTLSHMLFTCTRLAKYTTLLTTQTKNNALFTALHTRR